MAMDGLAAQMAGPQQAALQGGGMQGAVPTIEEIVALLMQGIPPEELVNMGVPPEMIMEAVAMLEQQMAAQAAPDQGLAARAVVSP